MNLIRYNPDRWFDSVFNHSFGDFFAPTVATPANRGTNRGPGSWAPRVEIRDNDTEIVLEAEVPGADRDSLDLEVKDGILTLKGEKKREATEEKEGVYRSERVYGSFTRQFRLPDEVDGDNIAANYVNGVLTVTLPKKPEAAARRIEVKTENGDAKQIGTH